MKAKVVWEKGMSFTGSANSGFEVRLGTDPSVGGDNDGLRPLELMAISLAGCTAMDVVSILNKKRQAITAFEVRVDAGRESENPKVFTHATIHYHVTGRGVEEAALIRAIELSATRYCPAQAMLVQVFPMEFRYKIYEQGEGGKAELVAQGSWQPEEVVQA